MARAVRQAVDAVDPSLPIASVASMDELVRTSLPTARLLRDQLYGVAPGDLTTLLAVTALLLVVSVIAVCIPSWRAMKVSPASALAG